ncbi:MAG: hypothetical protein KDN22_30235 [Verrucomicrobiae bacterium]|nr:hypothetical protein [Verrucomicrobiae bacterium]
MIDKDDIASWLDSQSDFALEMKVFSLTTSLGFEAEHGGTYSDPVTDRPRQFDIRSVGRNENRSIKLAIECKSLSTEFPLVIQRVPRTEKESFHDVMYAYEPDSGPMGMPNVFDNSKILRTPTGSPLYPIAQPVGKSSNQIGKKNDKLFANDKEVYDKWAQAISSAHDLVDDSVYERERLGFSDSFSVIFPVLIVPDDCLWCVDYDKEGKRLAEPKVTNETSFYISKEYWKKGQMHAAYTASHLHIMTFSGYKHFTGKIASNIRFWAEVYPPNNLAEKE